MKVGILKPFTGTYRPMLDVYRKILDYNEIQHIELDINDSHFWNKLKDCDLFLAKFSQIDDDLSLMSQILPIINNFLNIPSFPNYNTAWHYDDKVKQYYLLKQLNFPIVNSYIFWDKYRAMEWAINTEYPKVFKLKGGSGSTNVSLIKGKAIAIRLINKAFGKGIHPRWYDFPGKLKAYNWDLRKISKFLFKPYYNRYVKKMNAFPNYTRHKNYVYFQDYLSENEYDTRVAILGDRAWAFKRFNRKNDFRASGSNMYDTRREEIDKNMIKIAFEVSNKLGFQSMAYDFVYNKNKEPVILEISYTYGDYPEFSTGYWDQDLNWHSGNYVPEYFELMDALNMPGLKQPNIQLDSPYKKASML